MGRPSSRRPPDATMSSESPNIARTALLKHLDRVYEMARVLAPTEKRASKLVEATYRRAAQSAPPDSSEVRPWLLRLLLQTYATRRSDAATTSSVSTMRRPADLLQDFRFQAAEDALQRALPVAFALQPARKQLVLTLCDIVSLELPEAAAVLDTDPQTLDDELSAARHALWTTARRELTQGERELIAEELADDALQDALSRVVAPHLGPLPPTLRPSVSTIIEQPTSTPEAPDDVPDGANASPSSPPFESPPSEPDESERAHYVRRTGFALLIILVTGLAGYLLTTYLTPSSSPASTDLIQLSAQQADAVEPGLQTRNPAEAELFVEEQLGRQIAIPRIDSAMLRGVSIVEMDGGVRVPAFIFADATSDHRITTYAYTYAVIDRFGERVQLAQDVRQELQEEQQINLHSSGESGVLVWRVRDDIYVAVTKADPRRVRTRIGPSS